MPAFRGNRLVSATIQEGSIRVIDADGNVLVTLGRQDDGEYGIRIDSPELTHPTVLYADTAGMALPFYAAPFRAIDRAPDTNGGLKVTGTTFQSIFRTEIELLQWDAVRVRVPAITSSSDTAEVRISNVSNGQVTDAQSVTSAGGVFDFRWLHGGTLGTGPHYFEVQARQVTGSGGVWVYGPDGGAVFYRGSFMDPAATTTGT